MLAQAHIDLLLGGVDLMIALARTPDLAPGSATGGRRAEIDRFVATLAGIVDRADPLRPRRLQSRLPPHPQPRRPTPRAGRAGGGQRPSRRRSAASRHARSWSCGSAARTSIGC